MARYQFSKDEVLKWLNAFNIEHNSYDTVFKLNRLLERYMADNGYRGRKDVNSREKWLRERKNEQNADVEREMNELLAVGDVFDSTSEPTIDNDREEKRERYEFMNAIGDVFEPRYHTRNVQLRKEQREQFEKEENEMMNKLGLYAEDERDNDNFANLRRDIRVQLGKHLIDRKKQQYERMSVDREVKEEMKTITQQFNQSINDFGKSDVPYVDMSKLLTFNEEQRNAFGKQMSKLLSTTQLPNKPGERVYLQVKTVDETDRNFTVNPQNIQDLIDAFQNLGFIDSEPTPFIYEDEGVQIPDVSYIQAFRFVPYSVAYGKDDNNALSRNVRELGWFPYMLKEDAPQWLKDELLSAQIISRDNANYDVFRDCCLIYALKQAGLTSQIVEAIENSRLKGSRFQDINDVIDIWQEFELPYTLIHFDAQTHKRDYYHGERKSDMPELVIMYSHVFYNKQTSITKYNLEHMHDNENRIGCYYNKGEWWHNGRKFSMQELIMKLFEIDMFVPWRIEDLAKIPRVIESGFIHSPIKPPMMDCRNTITFTQTSKRDAGTRLVNESVDSYISEFDTIECKKGDLLISGTDKQGRRLTIRNISANPLYDHKPILGVNPSDYLTIGQVAKAIIEMNMLKKEPRFYQYGGCVNKFIQQAIRGGKAEIKDNHSWHINEPLTLLDVNSLYPTALSMLKMPLGTPKLITDDVDLSTVDYYIANVNVDDRVQTLDKITIDAFYPHAKILEGYYWNEGTTDRLKDVIHELYSMRQRATTPDERKAIKLLLNSMFGKMIQKPMTKKTVILPIEKVGKYVQRHYQTVLQDKALNDKYHEITIRRGVVEMYSYSLVGVMCLSMSHVIMKRYFDIASKNNIPVYYSHTDSLLIPSSSVHHFNAFIGDELGQLKMEFGSDVVATETWIINKCCYCCKLSNGDFHIRTGGRTIPEGVSVDDFFATLFTKVCDLNLDLSNVLLQ